MKELFIQKIETEEQACKALEDIYATFKDELCKCDNNLRLTRSTNSYTDKQRGSLHIWCAEMACVLNDAGLHMIRKAWDGDELEIDWNMERVKEYIYKPLLKAMTGKVSTEDQTTVEPSDVVRHLARHYADRGIIVPVWPSYR